MMRESLWNRTLLTMAITSDVERRRRLYACIRATSSHFEYVSWHTL